MRVYRILAVVLAVAAIGAIVGCGGDDDDDEAAAPEATAPEEEAAGGGGATEVGMTEYAFDPKDVTAAQGDTITATNNGEIPHNFTIEDNGKELATTGDVDPGSSGEVAVDVDPGDYQVICTIPGHAEQGMEGTITVE
jgi:plastocyanin